MRVILLCFSEQAEYKLRSVTFLSKKLFHCAVDTQLPRTTRTPFLAENKNFLADTLLCCVQVEAVRQAASRALVVLGTGVSAVLVVALGGICQRVNAVINNNRPSLAVRTHLLELLVGFLRLVELHESCSPFFGYAPSR